MYRVTARQLNMLDWGLVVGNTLIAVLLTVPLSHSDDEKVPDIWSHVHLGRMAYVLVRDLIPYSDCFINISICQDLFC